MADDGLGRIEEVDLREIWQNEAGDFTPWLAAHLDLLGEALHLDLSLVESEANVGSFAVDILADTGSGVVVIENQLERTDHNHLGQLLTYAAGRDARVLIWIAPEFRDEHRAVLDWLNRWTPEEIEVYGVEVRAIRIGDSLRAPEFKPVAFPNTWSRQSGSRSAGRTQSATAASSNSERLRTFFQPVVAALHKQGLTNRERPYAYYAQRFPTAARIEEADYMVSLRSRSRSQGGLASVYFYLGSGNREMNTQVFNALESDRESIERELGEELHWEANTSGVRLAVRLLRRGFLDDTPEELAELQAWMIEMLPKLKAVFEPRLAEIAQDLQMEQGLEAK